MEGDWSSSSERTQSVEQRSAATMADFVRSLWLLVSNVPLSIPHSQMEPSWLQQWAAVCWCTTQQTGSCCMRSKGTRCAALSLHACTHACKNAPTHERMVLPACCSMRCCFVACAIKLATCTPPPVTCAGPRVLRGLRVERQAVCVGGSRQDGHHLDQQGRGYFEVHARRLGAVPGLQPGHAAAGQWDGDRPGALVA